MENKTTDSTQSPLVTEPILVDAIVETVSNELECIKELLSRNSFLAN